MNTKKYQCQTCQNSYPWAEVFIMRGKQKKEVICSACQKNQSHCAWCNRDLTGNRIWELYHGDYQHRLEEWKKLEEIERDGKLRRLNPLMCEKNESDCWEKHQKFHEATKKAKRQTRRDQGWKKCSGRCLPEKCDLDLKDCSEAAQKRIQRNWFEVGKCWKLIPPTEKYCHGRLCSYNRADSEQAKQKKRNIWSRKYQLANQWWNSLSLEQKQAEINQEEAKLRGLGVHQQKLWLKTSPATTNSIIFENDHFNYTNWEEIPVFLLDKFSLSYGWETIWKPDNQSNNNLAVQNEIKQKELELQKAQSSGDKKKTEKIRQELNELLKQQSLEKANKNNTIIYWTGAIFLIALIGTFLFVYLKKQLNKSKKLKTKL